jgi:hypothetical protein
MARCRHLLISSCGRIVPPPPEDLSDLNIIYLLWSLWALQKGRRSQLCIGFISVSIFKAPLAMFTTFAFLSYIYLPQDVPEVFITDDRGLYNKGI